MTGFAPQAVRSLSRHGVLIALVALIVFGWIRYDNFLGSFNVLSVLRYNAMFALVALGMAYVIMTGGIDLSVGSTAALGSVVAALLSPYGALPGLLGGLGAGLAVGACNAFIIIRLNILPFIATLATMLAASGCALLLAGNQSVSVSYESGFTELGQGDFLGFPIPAWIAPAADLVGSTLAGVLLLGLIFNILNFENGLGWISLSAYWQSVIRGVFLLLVVAIQARLVARSEEPARQVPCPKSFP